MPSKRSSRRSTQIYKVKHPLSYLRLQQITALGFIDDLITLGRSFFECEKNIKLIATLIDSLKFRVHPNKSIFAADTSIEYLGFEIDSESMFIPLT